MTKEQIQDKLDQTKTQLNFGFGGQDLYVSISTYQEYLESTFTLLHQLLTESVFPENELAKTITENKASIEANKNEPQSVAFSEIDRKTTHYPVGHPFYASSPDEDIADLNAVTRDQLVDFYNNVLGASNGVGTIIGDIDDATAAKLVATAFGDWKAKVPYTKIDPEFFATSADKVKIVTPDKENAAVVGAISFKMDRNNPDYPAMRFGESIPLGHLH